MRAFGLSLSLCVLAAGVAWRLSEGSLYLESGGLKPIAHYARITSRGTSVLQLRIGNQTLDDVVMPDLPAASSGRLLIIGRSWELAPGPSGDPVGNTSSAALGHTLAVPGTYSIRRGLRRADFRIEDASRIEISIPGLAPTEAWLRPGSQQLVATGGLAVRFNSGGLSIDRHGKTATLARPGHVSVDGAMVAWIRDDPAKTPVFMTLAGGNELFWPGTVRYLPEVEAVISCDSGRRIRISSTDPISTLEAHPGGVMASGAKGTLNTPLLFHGRTYRVLTFDLSSRTESIALVALLRTPGAYSPWAFLKGGPIQSWNDAALYNPYPFVPVAECGSTGAQTSLWIPASARRSPYSGQLSTPARNTGSANPAPTPPSWITPGESGRGTQICRQGEEFHLTGLTEAGSVIAPPMDAVLMNRGSSPRPPGESVSLALSAGDVIFTGGQVYLLTGRDTPPSLALIAGLIPLTFIAAAGPLAWLLGRRLSCHWVSMCRTGDWWLRLALVLAPVVGLAAIVGMLTVGAYFQLLLAASSQLAGHPAFFETFLTSGVEALAGAAFLARMYEAGSGKRLLRSLGFASLSLGIGSAVLLWIEPALHRVTGAPQLPPGLPMFSSLSLTSGLLPAFFLIAAFSLLRNRDRRIPAVAAGQDATFVLWQRFVDCYHGVYQRWVTAGDSKSSMRPRFIRPLLYYIGWAAFPLLVWRLACAKQDPGNGPRSLLAKAGSTVGFLICALPVPLLLVAVRIFPLLGNLGKEAIPALVVLWAAWVLGRISFFVQARQTEYGAPLARRVPGKTVMLLSAVVFMFSILLLPRFFDWIYEPKIITLAIVSSVLTCIVTCWYPAWRTPATLLFHVLPFFGVLFLCCIVFNDFGALLVWTWALSWIGAWALMLNVLLADPESGWATALGTLPCSLILLFIPLTVLGAFNLSSQRLSWIANAHSLHRPVGRFRLVAAPFYYDSGEWLAKVQLMAAGQEGSRWIPNLNSDVALNGLRYFLPREHYFFLWLLLLVLIMLILAFSDNFRYAARAAETVSVTEHLQTALFTAVALFGLGMLLFVHLGASVFDVLPLTGVPCPWLSNAIICHVVMTSLVMAALITASERALKRGGSPDAGK